MSSRFNLVAAYHGYQNKIDITNIEAGVLVTGSQNVISTDGARVALRKGYTLDGAANASLFPIVSSYEWTNHMGNEWAVRSWDNRLEVRYNGQWYLLKTFGISGSGQVDFNFAEWWDATNIQDLLLMVNGSSNIYDWTGAVATFASATVNTITKQGSDTWLASGFVNSGTRTVVINGVEATYTGGENTTTLTGVSVDFSATTAGTPIFQGIRTQPNSAITSTNVNLPADFPNDLIAVLSNQIYLGCLTRRTVFMSKVNAKDNFSRSSPRLPGEGEVFTLDDCPVGFVVQEENMYMTGGQDGWYLVNLTLSADLTKETVVIKKLKTNTQKAAQSQSAIGKLLNDIAFITKEPTLDTLGRVQQIVTPQTSTISDPIKLDFNSYDFTNVHTKYFQNNFYVALPVEGKLLIYNIAKSWWEAPQTMPISRLAIIGGKLYGHSSIVPETYKLFEGLNDNGDPIDARAKFSYENFGIRSAIKNFDEEYVEGYISSNTIITVTEYYDYTGFGGILEKEIKGTDANIVFQATEDDSLGTHSLGDSPLGGGGADVIQLPPKFRAVRTFQKKDFFERQIMFSSNDVDQQWEIICFGPNVQITSLDPVSIKD